jgi:hypothetical protein
MSQRLGKKEMKALITQIRVGKASPNADWSHLYKIDIISALRILSIEIPSKCTTVANLLKIFKEKCKQTYEMNRGEQLVASYRETYGHGQPGDLDYVKGTKRIHPVEPNKGKRKAKVDNDEDNDDSDKESESGNDSDRPTLEDFAASIEAGVVDPLTIADDMLKNDIEKVLRLLKVKIPASVKNKAAMLALLQRECAKFHAKMAPPKSALKKGPKRVTIASPKGRSPTPQDERNLRSPRDDSDDGSARKDLFHDDDKSPSRAGRASSMRDDAENAIWDISAASIEDNLSSTNPSSNLAHLCPQPAKKMLIDNTVMLLYNTRINFYNVVEMSKAGVKVSARNISAGGEQEYTLDGNTPTYSLTDSSVKFFVEKARTSATFQFDDTDIETTTKSSTSTKKKRGCDLFDSEDETSSKKPAHDYGDSLAEAFTKATSSKSKMSLGSHADVSKKAMAIQSSDPIPTRDTDILITYQKLNASLSAKLPTSPTLDFWGLPAYNTQLQPIEMADLGKSWCAVEVNKFASLNDQFGSSQAIIEARKYYHPRAEADSNLQANLNIIGNQGDNLNRCLRILGMTLDVLYNLKPAIRQALKHVIERYMTYVTAYAPGPHSNISGEMYQAIASDFQIQVNTVYMWRLRRRLPIGGGFSGGIQRNSRH